MTSNLVNNLIYEDDSAFNLIWDIDSRRARQKYQRRNYFHELDDVDFIKRFRLSKPTALSVLHMIEDKLEYPYECNDSVSPINQLLATLRFYATNCDQLTCADFGGFSKSTAHRIVDRVSCAIADLLPNFIKFPSSASGIQDTQLAFYNIASFHNVIGAIDCTHIKISSPGGNTAELFRNRKQYFSFNVQGVCNANLEFMNLVARWPGRSHDSDIFKNSKCCADFEMGKFGRSVLLGDAGYGCRRFLLTPLDTPCNQAEELYNESHIRTRNTIERTFGVWKRRFPVLALGIRVGIEKAMTIIVATAVLHNILRQSGEAIPPDDPDIILPAPWEELLQNGDMNGRVTGNAQHFRREFAVRHEIIISKA